MSDKPHENAVRSPWTEGAWIMLANQVPEDWQVRHNIALGWRSLHDFRSLRTLRAIVEARPVQEGDQ